MALAKHEKAGKGCLGRSHDNEPVFVLTGRDKLAAQVVEFWANLLLHTAEVEGQMCPEVIAKADDAHRVATMMRQWPVKRLPGSPT